MTRSIDNFLTKEEQNMIIRFIEKKEKRPITYNEETHGLPPEVDTKPLESLRKKKYHEWSSCLRGAMIPNQEISYMQMIEKNDIPCAIKGFLTSLKKMQSEETPIFEFKNVLQDLDRNLKLCGASCPYPPCVENS